MNTILNGLVPCPARIVQDDGRLPVEALKSVYVPDSLRRWGLQVLNAFKYFGKELHVQTDGKADIVIGLDPTLDHESWRIDICTKGIQILGGNDAGLFYANSAFEQLLALAFSRGLKQAVFDCGKIEDKPHFGWRGFMLDSARHFQSKEKIKEVIRLIAQARLNVFHWHLVDIQGWRIPSAIVQGWGDMDAGLYSMEDIREIIAFAAEHFVRIVPELDMPGHSGGLLRRFPQYACDSQNPGNEFCLGNPEGRKFLKALLSELIELFPTSPVIHIGGDEAATESWNKCPKCRHAMEAAGLNQIRELENQFMNEMTRYVVSIGRQPMVWCTGAIHPADTIVHTWQSVNEILHTHTLGNPMVNSVHYSCYFDYPANSEEPRCNWMPELNEENVYNMFDVNHESSHVLGNEACLWTEMVPEWRVISKIAPRLMAFAERAWIRPDRKDWHDFQRRKTQLDAVGYHDFLRHCV